MNEMIVCKASLICIWTLEYLTTFSTVALVSKVEHAGFIILIYIYNEYKGKKGKTLLQCMTLQQVN